MGKQRKQPVFNVNPNVTSYDQGSARHVPIEAFPDVSFSSSADVDRLPSHLMCGTSYHASRFLYLGSLHRNISSRDIQSYIRDFKICPDIKSCDINIVKGGRTSSRRRAAQVQHHAFITFPTVTVATAVLNEVIDRSNELRGIVPTVQFYHGSTTAELEVRLMEEGREFPLLAFQKSFSTIPHVIDVQPYWGYHVPSSEITLGTKVSQVIVKFENAEESMKALRLMKPGICVFGAPFQVFYHPVGKRMAVYDPSRQLALEPAVKKEKSAIRHHVAVPSSTWSDDDDDEEEEDDEEDDEAYAALYPDIVVRPSKNYPDETKNASRQKQSATPPPLGRKEKAARLKKELELLKKKSQQEGVPKAIEEKPRASPAKREKRSYKKTATKKVREYDPLGSIPPHLKKRRH